MPRKASAAFQKTQIYKLGVLYKELGEMLMDERTDLRDLVALTQNLGIDIQISIGEEEK